MRHGFRMEPERDKYFWEVIAGEGLNDDKMLEDGLWDAMHCGVSIDIINCQYWDVHTSAEEFSLRIQKYIQLYERKVRIMQMDYTDGYEIEDVTETELSYAA